jgi:hypothetical protein
MIGLIVGAVMAVVGILALVYILASSQGCPADGRFADPGSAYRWQRDSNNYCRWTLWDAEGNPAPEAAYTEPVFPYPGPTPRPLAGIWLGIVVGFGLVAVSIAGSRRATRPT